MLLGMTATLSIMALSFLIGLWAWWQDRKPYQPGKLPLISPIILLYICAIVIIVMAAHLIELHTGEPFKGRNSSRF